MWRGVSCLILMLFVSAEANAQQLSVQRVAGVGESDGIGFGRISSVAVGSDGRVFVLDGMESRIHVFSPEGKHESTFGRRGGGPGELSNVARFLLFWRGQVIVIDPGNQRLSVFAVDGSFVRSRRLDMQQSMSGVWAATTDRVIGLTRPLPAALAAQFGGSAQHLVLALDPLGDAPPDTLTRVQLPLDHEMSIGTEIAMKVDLRVPQLMLASDGSQRILLAATDTYRIRVLAGDGRTTGWLTRTVPRHRYTNAEVRQKRQAADSMARSALRAGAAAAGSSAALPAMHIEFVAPELAPALTAIVAGDQFVLVARSEDGKAPATWDVLSYDGRFTGTLTLPATFRAHASAGDRIYGVAKDELDVESIVIYRIGPRR